MVGRDRCSLLSPWQHLRDTSTAPRMYMKNYAAGGGEEVGCGLAVFELSLTCETRDGGVSIGFLSLIFSMSEAHGTPVLHRGRLERTW